MSGCRSARPRPGDNASPPPANPSPIRASRTFSASWTSPCGPSRCAWCEYKSRSSAVDDMHIAGHRVVFGVGSKCEDDTYALNLKNGEKTRFRLRDRFREVGMRLRRCRKRRAWCGRSEREADRGAVPSSQACSLAVSPLEVAPGAEPAPAAIHIGSGGVPPREHDEHDRPQMSCQPKERPTHGRTGPS